MLKVSTTKQFEPDWLLIYRKTRDEMRFERLGSHSELFR